MWESQILRGFTILASLYYLILFYIPSYFDCYSFSTGEVIFHFASPFATRSFNSPKVVEQCEHCQANTSNSDKTEYFAKVDKWFDRMEKQLALETNRLAAVRRAHTSLFRETRWSRGDEEIDELERTNPERMNQNENTLD